MLHGGSSARDTALPRRLRNERLCHKAVCLTAQFLHRRPTDPRQGHVAVGDNGAAGQCRMGLPDGVLRKAQVLGIVKVRCRMDHAFHNRPGFRRQRDAARAEPVLDDRHALPLDLCRSGSFHQAYSSIMR